MMPQAKQKIKAVVFHGPEREVTMPVSSTDHALLFVAETLCDGFRAAVVKEELHIYGPGISVPDGPKPGSSLPKPGSNAGSNSPEAGSNVVLLRPNKDLQFPHAHLMKTDFINGRHSEGGRK